MSQTKVQIKRSAVEGKVPLTTDIDLGELAINTYDGKLFLKKSVSGTDSIVEVGGNVGFDVKNQTGSTIPKGTLVGFSGTLGSSGKLLVAPFLANGSQPSTYAVGIVDSDIPDGGDGFAVDHGKIFNLNTLAFPQGTILYASSTVAGALTATQPAAPNNKITVAAVVNSHASAGILEVRLTIGSSIANDELVNVTGLVNNDILVYDSTDGAFENKPITSIVSKTTTGVTSGNITINSALTDVYLATGLTGSVTFLAPSGTPANGQKLVIRLKDDGSSRSISWNTSTNGFRAIGVTLPATTVAGKLTYVGCVYNSIDLFWDVVASTTEA